MKTVLLAAICLALLLPATVIAADNLKQTKRIYQVNDDDIYIDRFRDQGNICYVAYENRVTDAMPSISCLKED